MQLSSAPLAATVQTPAPSLSGFVRSLWLLWVIFVIYGSLVPLEFRHLPWDEAVARFAQVPMLQIGVQGRADWVANGVLYVPVGFLTACLLASHGSPLRRLLASSAALGFSLSLAIAVEFCQLYFPQRTVSRNDLIAEGLGSLLGVLLGWRGASWPQTLLTVLQGHWRSVAPALVPGGVVVLVMLSLFPFDLLITAQELAGKFAGPMWGWWMAPTFTQEPAPRQLAGLLAEALILAPLGALWARSRQQQPSQQAARVSLARALALGLVLGLVIELGQWLTASGVSQGVSVLSRGAGWMLGAWLWNRRAAWGVTEWRTALRRLTLPLVILHALAAAVLSGWFSSPWRAPADALVRATGGELRFVPFYYHYYTSEAVAMYSLLATAMLYAPISLWCWARSWSARRAALVAAAAAVVVEAGKLFPIGTRPDPTNVLVAGGVAALVLVLLQHFTAARVGNHPDTMAADIAVPASPLHLTKSGSFVPLVLAAVLATAWLVDFPILTLWLGLLLLFCAAVVLWRPVLVFGLAAAALPALDLSPWSGREYVDEFDMLLLVGLAAASARVASPARAPAPDRALTLVMWLLACSVGVSALIAWRPWDMAALGDAGNPLSPWHALRLAKGLFWALCLYALARRQQAAGLPVAASFAAGMVFGVLTVLAFVLWERAAFVGLWDFAAIYRVAGPVAAMKLGGAYLDAGLVTGLAFALTGALHAPRHWQRVLCATAAIGAVYAVAVTFTRTTYVAAAVVVALGALTQLRHPLRHRRTSLIGVGMLGLLAATAYPIVTGPFASARLATIAQDLNVRIDHWKRTVALAGDGITARLIGNGLRSFPAQSYWARAVGGPGVPPVAVHGFVRAEGVGQLQLGPGPGLYVDQVLADLPGQSVEIRVSARSAAAGAHLWVGLCHKWLLSSDDCKVHTFDLPASGATWQRVSGSIQTGALGDDRGPLRRPVRLSLHNEGSSRIDIDQVSLRDSNGRELLRNSRFDAGGDHWTYTSDDHLAWHVKNMPLSVWFEQGLLGVTTIGALLVLALQRGMRAAWSGDHLAQATTAALVGLLIVSLFDTVIDEPRYLLLTVSLAWLAAMARPARVPERRGGRE